MRLHYYKTAGLNNVCVFFYVTFPYCVVAFILNLYFYAFATLANRSQHTRVASGDKA